MNATTLTDRALIRVAGDDPHGFLQGLVTSDTRGALPVWAGLLTPQGKALFDFVLWADGAIGGEGAGGEGGAVLIDCEAAQADALAKRLAMYRLRRAITIERVEDVAVHWSLQGAPADAGPDPRLAALGHRWLAPAGDAGDAAEEWRAHRLSLGVVEGVGELGSGETLWLECNAGELGGVSFTKGCYVGQENTARMHHRAKVNRRLVVAPLREAGERTRATYPELGWAVEHRRVEALGDARCPAWLAAAVQIGDTTR